MTNIEQQPELKTEMNTATDPDAQPDLGCEHRFVWFERCDLPSTAPSFNEDPRRGRHWSPDNAIQADDDSLRSIFASLDAMPALRMVPLPFPIPCLRPRSSNSRRPSLNRAHNGSLCNSQLPRKPLHHNL